MKGRKRLNRWTVFRVFLRSFCIQAVMNYERMQNIGFAFAMEPAVRRLYEKEEWNEVLHRHLLFFNSNPYLSSAILGAVLSMEERHANGEVDAQSIADFKQFMMGPVAALGDSFFWTCLKPFVASIVIIAALSDWVWAAVLFLVVYNLVQFSIRLYGVFTGYRDGEEVCLNLQHLALVRMGTRAQLFTSIALGGCGGLLVRDSTTSVAALDGPLEVFLFGSLVLLFLLGLRRKLDSATLLYLFGLGTFVLVALLNHWLPLT